MDPFATPEQLATRLGTATQAEADAGSPDVLDTLRAIDVLTGASGDIRAACRWSISQEANVVESISDWPGYRIYLRTLRLTAVAITVSGSPLVEGTDFTFDQAGWVNFNSGNLWWLRPRVFGWTPVTITYTHGYLTIPDDVVNMCLELAAQRLDNPQGLLSSTRDNIVEVLPRESGVGGLSQSIRARLARHVLPVVR